MNQLKKIPAFGVAILEQLEDLLETVEAVDNFQSWLESQSIVFKDDRRFDYQILAERGYNIVSADDLPRLINEWEQVAV